MTYERAAMWGAGLALAVIAAPYFDGETGPEQEPGNAWGAPTHQVVTEGDFVDYDEVQPGHGTDNSAEDCTGNDGDFLAVRDALREYYGGTVLHPGQLLGIPAVKNAAGVEIVIDCPEPSPAAP